MVNKSNNNKNNQDVGDKNPSSISRGISGGGGATWGTTASGQSVSTSGSVGSPSSRSETAVATPANDSTFLRLNNLDIQGDDAGSQGAIGNKKKKRGQRAAGGDKTGRGLRQFSMKVCEKVESKGRTTYNEVADELVAEFADPNSNLASPDQQQYDEKNIRRRVYDALNVLMAMDIISKDKKEIQWKGLPRTSLNDIEELKNESLGIRSRIEKKTAYLQELEEQYVGLQKLVQRNEQLYGSGNAPSGGVALPFILVQTRPHATVEVEISEDMQLVHFDFNSTPFELHDDNYVLKAMKLCENPRGDSVMQNIPLDGGESSHMPSIYQPSRSNISSRPPTSSPVFKAFFKSLSHPWVPASLNSFRNFQPTSMSKVLFRPGLEFLFHEQSEHGSFTQTFWTELVLECFALESIVSQEMHQIPSYSSLFYCFPCCCLLSSFISFPPTLRK